MRLGDAMGQARALLLDPSLEFRTAVQVEAVEKRAAVQLHRALELGALERAVQFVDVARDPVPIEPEERRAAADDLLAELASKGVENLRQRVACPLLRAFRPQQSEQSVAADSGAARREDGEHGNPPPLAGGPSQRPFGSFEKGPAECLQAKHREAPRPDDAPVIPR